MSKKLISLLLAVCILFCFSACGTTETNSNSTNISSESQTDTSQNIDEIVLTESENSQESSYTEEPKENDTTQTQTPANQSNPTTEIKQPTHTHEFAAANCTTSEKCSCGATQGSALGHQYQNGVCSVCNAINEEKYIEAQVNAADKAFTDYTKYNDALKIIKAALQKYPQNNILKTKRDYYQSFEPVNLCDLKPYKSSYGYISNGRSSDNFENEYEKCVFKPHYNSSASATYDLAYKYNSFKATVFMRCDCTRQVYGTIKIYGDGSLLYNKTGIDVYGRPFNIEVEVTGVQDLEIVIESESGAYIFGLGNCMLQRTVK